MRAEAASRFTAPVVRALKRAGWREGRSVAADVVLWAASLAASDNLVISEAARTVLSEFGGLRIVPVPRRSRGPMAAAPLELNPLLAEGEEERLHEMEPIAGEALYPLGTYDNGHQFVAIASNGSVFLVMDNMVYVRSTFDAALEALLTGQLCVPVDSLEQVRHARAQLG